MAKKQSLTYKVAGVDQKAEDKAIRKLMPLIKSTHNKHIIPCGSTFAFDFGAYCEDRRQEYLQEMQEKMMRDLRKTYGERSFYVYAGFLLQCRRLAIENGINLNEIPRIFGGNRQN